MEKTFREYTGFISMIIKPEIIGKSVDEVGQVGHFVRSEDGMLKPRFYPGFTLITPTYGDDDVNDGLYKNLVRCQDVLEEALPSDKYVRAPASALHMTVARLISGELFEKTVLNIREDAVLDALGAVLSATPNNGPLDFQIEGVAAMHGIIAAMVTTGDVGSYARLQSFRDRIYNDAALLDYGIERKRGFKGHITLLYIEDELTQGEKDSISKAITGINKTYFSEPVPFKIERTEVRRFDNYLSFDREKDWPAVDF